MGGREIQSMQQRHQRGFQLTRMIEMGLGMVKGVPGLPGGFQGKIGGILKPGLELNRDMC